MEETSTANNFSRGKVEGKRMWGTLSWSMHEGGLAGSVIIRLALMVVRRDKGVRERVSTRLKGRKIKKTVPMLSLAE